MTITIHTPTGNLQESLDFYKKLNFKLISERDPVLLTDGMALIEINPDRRARAGIRMYRESWSGEIEALKKLTRVYDIEGGHLLNDFNGCWIYLMDGELNLDYKFSDSSFAMVGNYAGLNMECSDTERSFGIWKLLGFSIVTGSMEKAYMVLGNEEGFTISLMKPLNCPHLFFNPSMTFFNGKENLAVIERIRKTGIPITEEITTFNQDGIVDNIIIRDPGGYGFFIFSD